MDLLPALPDEEREFFGREENVYDPVGKTTIGIKLLQNISPLLAAARKNVFGMEDIQGNWGFVGSDKAQSAVGFIAVAKKAKPTDKIA